MAKIFIDSNILIDFLVEERGALNLAAVKLFENFSASDTICYSFGSISDVAYVLKNVIKFQTKLFWIFSERYRGRQILNVCRCLVTGYRWRANTQKRVKIGAQDRL